MHLFGLTGGLASGKSTVAAHLRARGVPVIDADELAREVVARGTPGLRAIVDAFGAGVLLADGALDRKRLAALVFSDDAKRRVLNGITHPRISARAAERSQELAARGEPLVCYEAALLVENRLADAFRPLIVVATPPELQLARAIERDGEPAAVIRGRLASQMPLADKVAAADIVIHNDGSKADLERRTDAALAAVCAVFAVDPSRFGLTADAASTA